MLAKDGEITTMVVPSLWSAPGRGWCDSTLPKSGRALAAGRPRWHESLRDLTGEQKNCWAGVPHLLLSETYGHETYGHLSNPILDLSSIVKRFSDIERQPRCKRNR